MPGHVVLPRSLTGVEAPIVVALGERFPMITAHKVLAAYGCLAPRLVTGQFDPTGHKALWPSTGNYCRGGVAVSRILGCRGVAILPENMSRERFHWLEQWVSDASDIIRTPGSESNVKEIYDECARLDADPHNIIFNQFCEFGNALAHYRMTGRALGHVFETLRAQNPSLRMAAFTSATGSAGTLAAGDRLKEDFGAKIVAVEALECPTLLYNGFGEHNIQGIGDKHVPYVHNVFNTDLVVAISDAATDSLGYLFNHPEGKRYLTERRGVPAEVVEGLASFGFSGIANVLAAVKTAKELDLGPNDAIVTVATDNWSILPQRAAQDPGDPLRRHVRRRQRRRGARAVPARLHDGPHPRADPPRAGADLQPGLLHLGGAAGGLAGGVLGPQGPRLLARPPRADPGLGRPDRGVQRGPARVAGGEACPTRSSSPTTAASSRPTPEP